MTEQTREQACKEKDERMMRSSSGNEIQQCEEICRATERCCKKRSHSEGTSRMVPKCFMAF
jgi:hypothetical protein